MHGIPGRNIAADLYMEHLKRVAIKHLGANKTNKAIKRVGKAIGTIAPLLDIFEDNMVKDVSGAHHRANDTIIEELMKVYVFTVHVGRKQHTFESPQDLLRAKSGKTFKLRCFISYVL